MTKIAPHPNSRYLRISQAVEEYNIGPGTLRQLIADKQITGYQIGIGRQRATFLVDRRELDTWLKSRATRPVR